MASSLVPLLGVYSPIPLEYCLPRTTIRHLRHIYTRRIPHRSHLRHLRDPIGMHKYAQLLLKSSDQNQLQRSTLYVSLLHRTLSTRRQVYQVPIPRCRTPVLRRVADFHQRTRSQVANVRYQFFLDGLHLHIHQFLHSHQTVLVWVVHRCLVTTNPCNLNRPPRGPSKRPNLSPLL